MGQARGGSISKAAWLSHPAWILVCQGPLGDAPSPEGVSLARVRESMATWRALVSAAPVRDRMRDPYGAMSDYRTGSKRLTAVYRRLYSTPHLPRHNARAP
jgi:hypothetical protein